MTSDHANCEQWAKKLNALAGHHLVAEVEVVADHRCKVTLHFEPVQPGDQRVERAIEAARHAWREGTPRDDAQVFLPQRGFRFRMAAHDQEIVIRLLPRDVIAACQFLARLATEEAAGIDIRIPLDGAGPALLETTREDGLRARALIMPLR